MMREEGGGVENQHRPKQKGRSERICRNYREGKGMVNVPGGNKGTPTKGKGKEKQISGKREGRPWNNN